MLSDSLKDQIKNRCNACIDRASMHFNTAFDYPEIMFNQRGSIAGTAHLQKNLIKLNATLLLDNTEQFLSQVIPHEVAHLIVFRRFGKVRPHGQEWQYVMREIFALPPIVRHKMDVSKTQGQQFKYQCGCGEVWLSIRRHNKVIKGQQSYVCRLCKHVLKCD